MIQEAMTNASKHIVSGAGKRKLTMDTQKMKQARLELAKQRQAIKEQSLAFNKQKILIKQIAAENRLKRQDRHLDIMEAREARLTDMYKTYKKKHKGA